MARSNGGGSTNGTVAGTHGFPWDATPDDSGIEWQVSQFADGNPDGSAFGQDPYPTMHVKGALYGNGSGPATSGEASQ